VSANIRQNRRDLPHFFAVPHGRKVEGLTCTDTYLKENYHRANQRDTPFMAVGLTREEFLHILPAKFGG
jgi:hypothetical protein